MSTTIIYDTHGEPQTITLPNGTVWTPQALAARLALAERIAAQAQLFAAHDMRLAELLKEWRAE